MNQQLIRVLSLAVLTFVGGSSFNSAHANDCSQCYEEYVAQLQECRARWHSLHSKEHRLECEGDAAAARSECLQENACI